MENASEGTISESAVLASGKKNFYCAVTPFQLNFSGFKICIRHIHNYTEYNQQLNVIGQLPTASSVLLMVSRIIYLFK